MPLKRTTFTMVVATFLSAAACGDASETTPDSSVFPFPDVVTDTAADTLPDVVGSDDGFDAVPADVPAADVPRLVPNFCGGSEPLAGIPGDVCGACDDGRWRCDGPSEVVCAGAHDPNVCGGCGILPGSVGSPCGPCGGTWQCDGETATLVCEGGGERNACGGCGTLPAEPNFGCFNGIYTCDGPNVLTCRQTGGNACGGNADVVLENPPGESCGACGQGLVVCDGSNQTACADGELGRNLCGGCGTLPGTPDGVCGCGGVWACGDDGSLSCLGGTATNACGGCAELAAEPGAACDEGAWACDGIDAVRCSNSAANLCGGALVLDGVPGDACGSCGDGVLQCASEDVLSCVGASATNQCGSCGVLPGRPGDACGTNRQWQCRAGALQCSAAVQRNECGGSARLAVPPGGVCGDCELGIQLCVDANSTECFISGRNTRNVCGGCEVLTVDNVPFDDVPGAPCGVCGSGSWVCDAADQVSCVGEDPRSLRRYFADRDGDDFGSADETRDACSLPFGFVENALDCDDTDDSIRPGATERCDAVDNDCDGDIDEDFVAFVDADRDGFGTPDLTQITCNIASGLSRVGTDCDDTDRRVFPGQTAGFSTPRASGSFDYDCDGIASPLLTDLPECDTPPLCGTDGLTFPLQGWAERPIPGCGDVGPWVLACQLSPSGCLATIDPNLRPQLCR